MLAAFGLLHGVREWSKTLALSLPSAPLFEHIGLLLLAVSFASLFEFGRRGLWRSGKNRIGSLPVVTLLAASGVAWLLWSQNECVALLTYTLGLPGAIATGAVLWTSSRKRSSSHCSPLRVAAVSMFVYGAAVVFAVPKAEILPAQQLNSDIFSTTLGIPVQLVLALAATAVSTGLQLLNWRQDSAAAEAGLLRVCRIPLALVLPIAAGWFLTDIRGNAVDTEFRERLVEQSSQIAQAINPELVSQLTFTSDDKDSPAFTRIRRQMIAYGKLIKPRGIYSMAMRDGQCIFGPEDYAEDDPMASPPGAVYQQPGEELCAMFAAGKSLVEGPTEDEYGVFVSALSPVFHPQSRRVIMLVGLDIVADDWRVEINGARLPIIIGTLVTVLILLAGLSATEWRSRLSFGDQIRYRHIETVCIIGVCLTLTGIISLIAFDSENRQRRTTFARIMEPYVKSIQDDMRSVGLDLDSVARLHGCSQEVDSNEFRTFVYPLARNGVIRYFQWVPRVPNAQGKDPAESYPIRYVEPLSGNEHMLGFDVAMDPVRYAALCQAAATGLLVASEPLYLNGSDSEDQGMFVFCPAYSDAEDGPVRVTDRDIEGFAVAAVPYQDVLRRSLESRVDTEHLAHLRLIDLMADDRKAVAELTDYEIVGSDALRPYARWRGIRYVDPIFAFGRVYAVTCLPTPAFFQAYPARTHQIVMVSGLLISLVLAVLAGFIRNRQAHLEREVYSRTVRLRAEKDNLAAIFTSSPVGMLLLNDAGMIVQANGAIARMVSRRPADIISERAGGALGCIHSRQCEKGCGFGKACGACLMRQAIARVLDTNEAIHGAETQLTLLTGGNERRTWFRISAEPVMINDRRHVILALDDITDRKLAEQHLLDAKAEIDEANRQLVDALHQASIMAAEAEQAKEQVEEKAVELSYRSSHDSLTGLPNRHYFEQGLCRRISLSDNGKSMPFAVLFLDLDKFKLVNDTLGHKVGDMLLVEVAERIKSCLRSDDLLARMGGDEFTIMISHCYRRSSAEMVAARIIDSISRPFDIDGHRFMIGASIGLARYPTDGQDAVTLLKHADTAMYTAKQTGTSAYRWYAGDVEKENRLRLKIETDIRFALEKEQFKVYYQPIVNLRDGTIHGAEALLRWEHPERGMISPSLFVPIAEEIGLMNVIGDFVLRCACSQMVSWQNEGIQLSQISVNVSTSQVHSPDWLNSVQAAISDFGLNPRNLCLELTETDFAQDYESVRKALQEVEAYGINVAIDDFGMGHSSLSRLKDLPLIHLKIDGTFVRDIEHSGNDKALLYSIIEMAHGLGIRVTAEWVETQAQMEIIRSSGCDFGQGFYFSPPLAPEQFRDFLANQRRALRRRSRAA